MVGAQADALAPRARPILPGPLSAGKLDRLNSPVHGSRPASIGLECSPNLRSTLPASRISQPAARSPPRTRRRRVPEYGPRAHSPLPGWLSTPSTSSIATVCLSAASAVEPPAANRVAAECIYSKRWMRPSAASTKAGRPTSGGSLMSDGDGQVGRKALSKEDDAKLMFGAIFSLRNMVKQLGGEDDTYACPCKSLMAACR